LQVAYKVGAFPDAWPNIYISQSTEEWGRNEAGIGPRLQSQLQHKFGAAVLNEGNLVLSAATRVII
jgi:hypothetical protein